MVSLKGLGRRDQTLIQLLHTSALPSCEFVRARALGVSSYFHVHPQAWAKFQRSLSITSMAQQSANRRLVMLQVTS